MTTREEEARGLDRLAAEAELLSLARIARAREEFRQWRERCQRAGEKVPPPWAELPLFIRQVWITVATNKMETEAREALHG